MHQTMDPFEHFIAGVAQRPDDTQELHWGLRPYWHFMQVQIHDDGISVTAYDDLPRARDHQDPTADASRPGAHVSAPPSDSRPLDAAA